MESKYKLKSLKRLPKRPKEDQLEPKHEDLNFSFAEKLGIDMSRAKNRTLDMTGDDRA